MKMRNKLLLLVATVAIVVVGAASFAAFESHLINVRAHVEKATFVVPDSFDFGITLMQASYDADCDPLNDLNNNGNGLTCLSIHLSASFKTQLRFTEVDYEIWCEDKPPAEQLDGNIAPFIQITDSDPADGNDLVLLPNAPSDGCGSVAYGSGPHRWANGVLTKVTDEVDLWDMRFFAPLCEDNYNPATDPIDPADLPVPLLIAQNFCHQGPGPDSDEFTDLASEIKFQVTGFDLEVDRFPASEITMIVRPPSGADIPVKAVGPTIVYVDLASLDDVSGDCPQVAPPNGLEEVPTEIVAMELVGASPIPIHVRLRDPTEHPNQRSKGEIEEESNTEDGRLDLSPFAPAGAACSFFDVYVEVTLPDGTILHNDDPVRVETEITNKPPAPEDPPYCGVEDIPLRTEAEELSGFTIVGEHCHDPNPPPP